MNHSSTPLSKLMRPGVKRSPLFENLRAQQNAIGKDVAKASGAEKETLLATVKELAQQVKDASARVSEAEENAAGVLGALPNLVLEGVPAGGEENFVTLREVGEVPTFDGEPRDHLDLGESLGILDMERGVKVSGSRFYFLKGPGALMEMALMQLGMKVALENGFIPLIPPTLVKPEVMQGTGFLGDHAAEVYHLGDDDLYLTGTSEVALAGYHSDEIIDLSQDHFAMWASPLVIDEKRAPTAKTPGASFESISSRSWRCLATSTRQMLRQNTSAWCPGKSRCSSPWALPTESLMSRREIWGLVPRGSMTWRRGFPANLPTENSPPPQTAPRSSHAASMFDTVRKKTHRRSPSQP